MYFAFGSPIFFQDVTYLVYLTISASDVTK